MSDREAIYVSTVLIYGIYLPSKDMHISLIKKQGFDMPQGVRSFVRRLRLTFPHMRSSRI